MCSESRCERHGQRTRRIACTIQHVPSLARAIRTTHRSPHGRSVIAATMPITPRPTMWMRSYHHVDSFRDDFGQEASLFLPLSDRPCVAVWRNGSNVSLANLRSHYFVISILPVGKGWMEEFGSSQFVVEQDLLQVGAVGFGSWGRCNVGNHREHEGAT